MKPLVAYLGPDWTYSHLAVLKFQPDTDLQVACSTIDDVFAAILTGKADCGLVPIYNSASGLVSDTAESILRRLLGIDTLADQVWWKQPLCISGQLKVPVRHCLVGTGSLAEVSQVISKQQAVDQCCHWLKENLPQAALTPSDSSSAALPMLKADRTLAAIASQQAAAAAGIATLAVDIQDQKNNATEFVVVQRDDQKGFVSYPTCDTTDPLRFEYWVEEQRMRSRLSSETTETNALGKMSDSTWTGQCKFASRWFRFEKIGSNSFFQQGDSVTLEMDAIDSSLSDSQPLKRWRLGIA